jgi:hypothetical protein
VSTPAPSACKLAATPAIAIGSDTKFTFTVACTAGAKPNAMVISMAQTKPAITDGQGKVFMQGLASAMGISLNYYDSMNSIMGFTFPSTANPQTFEVVVPTAATELTSATYYIASGGVTDAKTCQATSSVVGCSVGAILVPFPRPKLVRMCPNEPLDATSGPPTLNALDVGDDSVTGKLPKTASGTVKLCRGGLPLGSAVAVDAKGEFTVTGLTKLSAAESLKAGDKVQAQFTSTENVSGSPSANLTVGSCAGDKVTGTNPQPTLISSTDGTGRVTYEGSVTGATTVRICVDDLERASVAVTSDSFSAGSLDVKAGSVLVAQTVSGNAPNKEYGPLSNQIAVGNCSSVETGNSASKPALNVITASGNSFSGKLSGAKPGTEVRICLEDKEETKAFVADDGSFSGLFPTAVKPAST